MDESIIYEPYEGLAPYIFVSYSHTEREKVDVILRLMFRNGIRIWYDKGLLAGENWENKIEEKLKNSQMFLCFLANGIEQRRVVLDEIRFAIKMNRVDELYKVVFVFLEKMPSSAFEDEDLRSFIDEKQHILYRGITESFIQKFLNLKVIDPKFVDAGYRDRFHLPKWDSFADNSIAESVFDDGLLNNSYVYPQVFPDKKADENFYRVLPSQIHPDACFPLCLDNQWCPTEFYAEAKFWENGFADTVLIQRRQLIQQTEIFRALLHNKQVVLNRAAIFNSQIFNAWYDKSTDEYAAFAHLLQDGSVLIYLMKERSPEQTPTNFQTTQADGWRDFCRGNLMYCLRMDWNSDANNNILIEKRLGNVFQQFCLNLPENKKVLNELSLLFDFTPEQQTDFEETCIRVQRQVANRDRDLQETRRLSRELFYKKFLVKQGTNIPQCVLDIRKPFAPELKELIDYKYSVNLPSALGIRALYPETGLFKRLSQVLSEGNNGREISWDELICAIGQFQLDFINEKVWHIAPRCTIDLKHICQLRDLPSWQNYMRAVSSGRKRASLNEVDFFDIQFVWKSYRQWLDEAKQRITELEWDEAYGSISIVFQIGNTKITVVYDTLNSKNRFKVEKESTFLKGNADNHSVAVYIDYFCVDIISSEYQHNCLISAIPLFEGMSVESESLIVDKITEQYETIGFKRIPEDPVKIRFKTHFLKKESSEEWRAYVELMQNRQNDFKYSQIYTIETDLKTICEFEIMNNMKIGVRYQSPFSIVVLDLVRDRNDNMFGYERILPAVPSGAVVCVPICNGKFVLLKQFRHALRTFQYGFPRGFGELELSPEQNAKKELFEELGCQVVKTEDLGEIVADSGLSGNKVRALLCEISTPKLNAEHEGLVSLELVSSNQLSQMISDHRINDGFTLAAYSLLNK